MKIKSLRIKGTKSEQVEIQIHYTTLFDEMTMLLRNRFGIDSDAYLDPKGRLVCSERGWRHGSIGEDLLDAEPSADVKLGLSLIDQLQDLKLRFLKEDQVG